MPPPAKLVLPRRIGPSSETGLSNYVLQCGRYQRASNDFCGSAAIFGSYWVESHDFHTEIHNLLTADSLGGTHVAWRLPYNRHSRGIPSMPKKTGSKTTGSDSAQILLFPTGEPATVFEIDALTNSSPLPSALAPIRRRLVPECDVVLSGSFRRDVRGTAAYPRGTH